MSDSMWWASCGSWSIMRIAACSSASENSSTNRPASGAARSAIGA